MRRKLSLDLDGLSIESFDTTPEDARGRGTVRGFGSDADDTPQPTPPVYYDDDKCTCDNTCLCPTAYYYCNTGPAATVYSCKYSHNASCYVTA